MSMTMLTIKQLTEIFIVYTALTVLLPAAVFHKKFTGLSLSVRFMAYITIGNFYIMNLVFLLQLLHISNWLTLWLMTLLPVSAATIIMNRIPVLESFGELYQHITKLLVGQMGLRTFLRATGLMIGRQIKKFFSVIWSLLKDRILEWIFLFGILGFLLWTYGANAFNTYGYTVSDVPVHNYWINAMGENKIFADGVYPFGFHCVIYYIHTVFGIDTYVLLRLFWLIQTIYIHLALFAFLKAISKTRFAAYIGLGSALIVKLFFTNTRFYSSLPQEFGMIFLLPPIYFALAFFKERKTEVACEWIVSKQKSKERKAEYKNYLSSLKLKDKLKICIKSVSLSSWYLVLYAMGFSMTLAVHFYNTVIAGLFCVAIAIAFWKRFFSKKYFWRVIAAFSMGIFVAILPMAIAFVSGTPIQGSINWGLNVIRGEGTEEIEEDSAPEEVKQEELSDTLVRNSEGDIVVTLDDWVLEKQEQLVKLITKGINNAYTSIEYELKAAVLADASFPLLLISILAIGALFILVVVSALLKRYDYAMTLVAGSIFIGLLFLLLGSGKMGLPALMDVNRSRFFLIYCIPILWCFAVDAPVYTLFGSFRKRWVMYVASLCVCSILGGYTVWKYPIQQRVYVDGLQTNQAVTCLTNIIRDHKDFTWTIVSANDELNMAKDHGRHTEIIKFLRAMEFTGAKGSMYLPTRYVYFFIEKVPIDYFKAYENSGQRISEEGAARSIPDGDSISIYQAENRWILMSKMYYWAKAYQKLYSNEMKVYYEDDSFICYQIEQNDYSLYNFAIDYGYNLPKALTE